MRNKIVSFFDSKYSKIIFSIVILCFGLGGGLYFAGPNAAQVEAMQAQKYFEVEEAFGQPEGYQPNFKIGDIFPFELNTDESYRRTLFLLMSPTCEPCEEQYELLQKKLFPYIASDVQILFCFDKEYQNSELPKNYQKFIQGNKVMFIDFDFVLNEYNLHMKPSLFVIDQNDIVNYIQIGSQIYLNEKLKILLI